MEGMRLSAQWQHMGSYPSMELAEESWLEKHGQSLGSLVLALHTLL